jgi:membrane-bound serine protease (ClpP class)
VDLVALAVLVVVAIAVAVGVHSGPHGLLAAGAIGVAASVAFVVGVMTLAAASSRPAIAWALLAATAVVSVGALVAGAVSLPTLRRRQPATGPNRLFGAEGVATSELTPRGTVRVRGETWTAESVSGNLPVGAAVHVMEVDGLCLRVWSDAALPAGLEDATHATRDEERA